MGLRIFSNKLSMLWHAWQKSAGLVHSIRMGWRTIRMGWRTIRLTDHYEADRAAMGAVVKIPAKAFPLASLLSLLITASCSSETGAAEGRVIRDPTAAVRILSSKFIIVPDSSEIIYFRFEDYVVGRPGVWAVLLLRGYRESKYLGELNGSTRERSQKPLVNSVECATWAAEALPEFSALGFDTARTTGYCNDEFRISARQQGPDLILFLKRDGH